MKKKKKAFWSNIRFKYKLTIVNENTLDEVLGLHVSKLNGFSWLLFFVIFVFLVASVIILFTPLRNYLPGYMSNEMRSSVMNSALKIDSLQQIVSKQQMYVMNIKDILMGEIRADEVHSMDSLTTLRADSLLERSRLEEEFRKQYEESERYNLTTVGSSTSASSLIFCAPVRGSIGAFFNPNKKMFGIRINTKPQDAVVATLDGTVVFSGYTPNEGYVIQIQHTHDLLSVYRNCGKLLKTVGDKVKEGEAIAWVSEQRDETDVVGIYFELWNHGNAIDPTKYIVF